MNDLDLNKAVAEKLGINTNPLGPWAATSTVSVAYSIPSFCNNWADGGPIIEKYKIDIKHREGAWYAVFSDKDHLVITDDDSALKAAMLCFLEMEI